MPALDDILQQKLAVLEAKHQKRTLQETVHISDVRVRRGGKELISFSGNDYLGLAHHPQVIAAAAEALKTYGTGAGASRLVTGNYPLYEELETLLAEYKRSEAACVFGSGYLANIGTIPALVGKGDLILADKLIHACMIDAAQLSGATVMRFSHNSPEHCRMLLEANRSDHHHCLILTETVFSMDGDRAPLTDLNMLSREFDAWLMTDDAHGLGVVETTHWVDIQMGTLSKAAGSYGGYVCGSKALIDYLKTASRSFIYSTGLPPASVAASIVALTIIMRNLELIKKPLHNARHFTSLLKMKEAQSAIVPIILKDSDRVLVASTLLEQHGFLVTAIRPPTVPPYTARLRFAFSASHEQTQIEAVTAIIKEQGWQVMP